MLSHAHTHKYSPTLPQLCPNSADSPTHTHTSACRRSALNEECNQKKKKKKTKSVKHRFSIRLVGQEPHGVVWRRLRRRNGKRKSFSCRCCCFCWRRCVFGCQTAVDDLYKLCVFSDASRLLSLLLLQLRRCFYFAYKNCRRFCALPIVFALLLQFFFALCE